MARILFAEDNDVLRRVVAEMLEQHGHQVIEVGSAAEAVAVLAAGTAIDVAISDLSLPGREDPRIMAQARHLGAAVPLIYVSGYPIEEAARRQELRPGAAFLPKPFDIDHLLATIDDALRDGAGGAATA